jgi:hypothetical protein
MSRLPRAHERPRQQCPFCPSHTSKTTNYRSLQPKNGFSADSAEWQEQRSLPPTHATIAPLETRRRVAVDNICYLRRDSGAARGTVWCRADSPTPTLPMNPENIQHPTTNIEHTMPAICAINGCWMFSSFGSWVQSANAGIGRILSPFGDSGGAGGRVLRRRRG